MAVLFLFSSKTAEASFFSKIFGSNDAQAADIQVIPSAENSQTLPILQANISPNRDAKGGGDITIENSALLPEIGPLGTAKDVKSEFVSDEIVNYVVRKGDTLAGIAKMFDVSQNTIIWANGLKKGQALTEGDNLLILPVTGVKYTVKKGDTLKNIAKKFKGDVEEIGRFNGITEETLLAIGDTLIIPDGDFSAGEDGPVKNPKNPVKTYSGPSYAGYYMRPIAGGRRTQGVHGHNGVDLADSVGTPVMASASGTVIISRNSGWNGGYGKYIVISHENGTQTLYSHLSETRVSVGEQVNQGQTIGLLGNTGKSTGAHLHFEIRGAKNPF